MNPCSKPGCGNPGAAILGYDYAERRATLDDPPEGEVSPHAYVLCTRCAEKLTPPRGWTLDDSRAEPPLFFDRAARDRDEAAAADALSPPEEPRRRQLFFGYTA